MTYRELLAKLATLPDAVLDQPAQVSQYDPPHHGVYELSPVYAAGLVGEMMGDDEVVRCNRDGGNNRDSFVLFADLCAYDEHGEMAYTENWDGTCTGVKTGVVVPSPFPADVAAEVLRRADGEYADGPSPDLTIPEFVRWVESRVSCVTPVWWLIEKKAFGGRTPMQVLEAGGREELVQMVYQLESGVAS